MSGFEEWIQFNVGQVRSVYALVTQGSDLSWNWITAYKMTFSPDSSAWTTYTDVFGNVMVGLDSSYITIFQFQFINFYSVYHRKAKLTSDVYIILGNMNEQLCKFEFCKVVYIATDLRRDSRFSSCL